MLKIIIGIFAGIFTGLGMGGGSVLILFLTLFFIQRKNDNQPTAKVLSLPFKIEEKYLSVTESDYQYSYHFISLETKEGSLLSKKTSNYQRKSNNI